MYQPLYDKVLLRRLEPEKVSAGGIIIPTAGQEPLNEAIVVQTGQGRLNDAGQLIPLLVKPGDHVSFGRYSPTMITVDGEELLILREDELLGIIKKDQ